MGSGAVKQLRGQLRQIVKEILPEVLKAELVEMLRKQVDARLNHIDAFVNKTMEEMNDRTKETQSYVVRNLALAQTVSTAPVVDSTAASK